VIGRGCVELAHGTHWQHCYDWKEWVSCLFCCLRLINSIIVALISFKSNNLQRCKRHIVEHNIECIFKCIYIQIWNIDSLSECCVWKVMVIYFKEHGMIIGQWTIQSEMLSREMDGEKSVFEVPPKVDGRNRRLQQQWVCVWILQGRLTSVVHSIHKLKCWIWRASASARTLCPFPKYSPVFQNTIGIVSEGPDDYRMISRCRDKYCIPIRG
jgi:hypothetical protein